MILAITLALGFWTYSGIADEFQYRVPLNHSYITCGAVGRAGNGMFYADTMGSGGASETTSVEFNTIEGAEAFVEMKCK